MVLNGHVDCRYYMLKTLLKRHLQSTFNRGTYCQNFNLVLTILPIYFRTNSQLIKNK